MLWFQIDVICNLKFICNLDFCAMTTENYDMIKGINNFWKKLRNTLGSTCLFIQKKDHFFN